MFPQERPKAATLLWSRGVRLDVVTTGGIFGDLHNFRHVNFYSARYEPSRLADLASSQGRSIGQGPPNTGQKNARSLGQNSGSADQGRQ